MAAFTQCSSLLRLELENPLAITGCQSGWGLPIRVRMSSEAGSATGNRKPSGTRLENTTLCYMLEKFSYGEVTVVDEHIYISQWC